MADRPDTSDPTAGNGFSSPLPKARTIGALPDFVSTPEGHVDTGEAAKVLYRDLDSKGDVVASSPQGGMTPEDALEKLIHKSITSFLSGGDGHPPGAPPPGSIPPDRHIKEVKRSNWKTVAGVITALITGGIGTFYGVKHMAEDNHQAITVHDKTIKQNQDDIRFIRVDISGIKDSVDTMVKEQKVMSAGITELKEENVTRLKTELEEAKRELRRERRR